MSVILHWFSRLSAWRRAGRCENEARAAYADGRMNTALSHARRLYDFDLHNPWANYLLACHHLEADRYADALSHLTRVAADWPADAWVWYAVGVCHDRTDDPHAAIAAYRRALSLRPHWAKVLKNIGRDLYLTGDFAQAETVLHTYCEMQPDDREAHDMLGYLCYRQGDLRLSWGHYERARRLDPANPKCDRNARLLYTRTARS